MTALSAQAAAFARGCISREPAKTWEQAMVTGNGLLGAMVYGVPLDETIIVNHGRLYLPMWQPVPPPDTAPRLPEIRHLLASGKYRQAAKGTVTCRLQLTTMDVAAVRELLTHLIAACKALGTEAESVPRWQAMLDKLPAYQSNNDGARKEP